MRVKKRFHHWTSELPGSVHGNPGLIGQIDRVCQLVDLKSNIQKAWNSKTGDNLFLRHPKYFQ